MAFIAEQAEGSATDGVNRILDIVPDQPAPADAAGDRQPGGRRLRGRHHPPRRRSRAGERRAGRRRPRARDASRLRPRRLGRRSRARPRTSGRVPLHPRRLPQHVHRPALDHAPVRRVRHRAGDQPPLPPAARRRADGAVHRVRSADADGLRLRPPDGAGRGGPGRRRHRHGGRPGRPLPRDPARPRLDLDDDQRDRGDPARDVRRGRGGAGRAAGQAHRHGAERRAQGVHRAGDVHLSGRAVAPAGGRHLPLRQRRGHELQPDLDQRLPHARGRGHGGAGGGLHARQRAGVRAGGGRGRARGRQLRAAAVVLLREPQRPVRGGGQVPRGAPALGPADPRALRRRATPPRGCGSTPRPAASRSRRSSRSTTWCG